MRRLGTFLPEPAPTQMINSPMGDTTVMSVSVRCHAVFVRDRRVGDASYSPEMTSNASISFFGRDDSHCRRRDDFEHIPMKPSKLRSIAVTVVEPKGGSFRWRLLESHPGDDRWTLLVQGATSFKEYARAMAAGLVALQNVIDDLSIGPRSASDPTEDKAVQPEESEAGEGLDNAPAEDESPRHRGPLFGFGPLT